MALFSYDHSWIPGWSPHSFAVFYRTDQGKVSDDFTISWLPATGPGDVRLFGEEVVGKNYSFEETMDYAIRDEKVVKLSGHYEVKDELYELGRAQLNRLNSGRVKYRVLGNRREGQERVLHCVHAVSDILPENKDFDVGWSYAEGANQKITSFFKDYLIDKVTDLNPELFSSYLKRSKNEK